MEYSGHVKDVFFNCSCGWHGSELDLDIISLSSVDLVCCPNCHNDDVRVVNELKQVFL